MGKFRVRELAQSKGLTQEDLSHKSGVKISTVRRIWQNRGADDPRTSTLRALATALEVTTDELFNPEYQGSSSAILPDKQMTLVGAPALG